MTDQSPHANPSDTSVQASLRAKVEAMMAQGRVRNAEGERVAHLPDAVKETVAEALLRHSLEDVNAELVLHADNSVTWEKISHLGTETPLTDPS